MYSAAPFWSSKFQTFDPGFFSRNSWYNTFEKGFRHNPWKRETPPLKKGTTTLEKGEPPFHNSSTLRQGYPWKRDTLEKGMMPSREPAGLDNALEEEKDEEMEDVEDEPLEKGEEEWRPGMKLRKNHPSWMWKQNRKDLASKEGRNKAGKKRGGGTTSQNRMARRAVEQPQKNKDYWGSQVQQDSNPWQRDEDWCSNPWQRDEGWWSNPWQRDEGWWSNPWQRGWWEHSWERDDGWWEHSWEREHSWKGSTLTLVKGKKGQGAVA